MFKKGEVVFPELPTDFRWAIVKEGQWYTVHIERKEENTWVPYVVVEVTQGIAGYPAEVLTNSNVRASVRSAWSEFLTQRQKERAEEKFLGIVE